MSDNIYREPENRTESKEAIPNFPPDDVSLNTPSAEIREVKVTAILPPIKTEDVELEQGGLSQDFEDEAETEETDTRPRIGKPNKDMGWFHVSPKPEHRMHVAVIAQNDKGKTKINIVAKAMLEPLLGEWKKMDLYLYQNEEGKVSWWMVKPHDASGDLDEWNESAFRAIHENPNQWLRRLENKKKSYAFRVAPAERPAPDWDNVDLADIKAKTLEGDIVIRDASHPVAQKLLKG